VGRRTVRQGNGIAGPVEVGAENIGGRPVEAGADKEKGEERKKTDGLFQDAPLGRYFLSTNPLPWMTLVTFTPWPR
jgi:hypothetical protein